MNKISERWDWPPKISNVFVVFIGLHLLGCQSSSSIDGEITQSTRTELDEVVVEQPILGRQPQPSIDVAIEGVIDELSRAQRSSTADPSTIGPLEYPTVSAGVRAYWVGPLAEVKIVSSDADITQCAADVNCTVLSPYQAKRTDLDRITVRLENLPEVTFSLTTPEDRLSLLDMKDHEFALVRRNLALDEQMLARLPHLTRDVRDVILVTATKRAEEITDIPLAITAVSVADVSDVLVTTSTHSQDSLGDAPMPRTFKFDETNSDVVGFFDNVAKAGAAARNMPMIPLRHKWPRQVELDEETTISIVVAYADIEAAEQAFDSVDGELVRREARLAPVLEAELSGSIDLVEIAPRARQRKSMLDGQNLTFSWKIKPRTTSPFKLTVRLFNVDQSGLNKFDTNASYEHSFLVNATILQKTRLYFRENEFIFTLLLGLLGVTGFSRVVRFLRSKKPVPFYSKRRRTASMSLPAD